MDESAMKCNGDCLKCIYDDCISDRRIYSEKSRYCNRTEEQKAYQRAYAKKKRDEAKASGLCIICRKNKAAYGAKCYECYIRQKRYDKNKCSGKREQWRETGLCYYCGSPVVPGKKVCDKHYQVLLRNAENLNNHPNTKNAREEVKRYLWAGKKI